MDPIIGRADELAVIQRFLGRGSATAKALLIEGDAGIGKTTVWLEGLRLAAAIGPVLRSRASEAEARLSFTVLGDLLVPALSDELLGRLPDGQRRSLEVALLLADHTSTVPDSRGVSLGVLAVLRSLASLGPVTLAIDDVQWVDPPSARALAFALRRLETEPVTVIVAKRWGTGLAEPDGLMDALSRSERIELAPMDEATLGQVLRARLDREFRPPLIAQIHRQTEGNPFFAIEVARAIGDDAPRLQPGQQLPVPRDLGSILHRRLASLSDAASEVCLILSAVPAPSRDVVESAGGTPAGIREALDAQILIADGRRLTFTHPLLASAVYGAASVEERRRTHARLAETAVDLEERARHLALSIEGPDDHVATVLDGAAEHARARGAPLTAAELYELAASRTSSSPERIASRRLQAAGHLYDAADTEGARGAVERLIGELAPGPQRAAALRVLAFMSWNDVRRVAELTSMALDEGGDDPDLRSRTMSEMAWAEFEACRPVAAVDLARTALSLAEPLPDPLPKRLALSVLSTAETVLGHPADELIRRGVALQETTAAGETTWPAITHGRLLLWTGELTAARKVLDDALEAAIGQGREAATWEVRVHLAEVEHRAGRWDRAVDHASAALDIARDAGRETVTGEILAVRAAIAATSGRAEDARRDGSEALARCERYWDAWYELVARSALGGLELSLGEAAAAHGWLAPVAAACEAMEVGDPGVFPFVPDEVEALVRLGDVDAAERLTDRLQAQGEALDRPLALATAGRCRGLIAGARRELDTAEAHLVGALDLHAAAGHPFETARTLLVAGELQRRMKRKRAARELLEGAVAAFDELGAGRWATVARAEAARIGGRPSSSTTLTATEARIARLVALGLTNKEAADALFVSPDTVKSNLKRIYAKLGARSRTELAVRLDVVGSAGTDPEAADPDR